MFRELLIKLNGGFMTSEKIVTPEVTSEKEQLAPKPILIHRNMTMKSQIVISPNKDSYIFIQNKENPFVITTSFTIENFQIYPCIRVPINRISHAQNLLKLLPGGIILHSDGNWIDIDIISKMINFESDNLKGFIQFQLLNKAEFEVAIIAVYKEIPHDIIQYIMFEINKEEIQPDILNISSIMLTRGSIVCITDAVEKILMIPIKDPKNGFIGIIKKYDLKLFNIYKRIWPELKFKVERISEEYHIYSNLFKTDLIELDGEHILRVHRNYGGSDIQITATHKLMSIYNNSYITNVKAKE